MKIKPMLARLESAMGRHDLVEQMVLVPESASSHSDTGKSSKSINLVVGYNSSPRSQTALDLTLWIAYQTRLVTRKKVTVQVVYVVDENSRNQALEPVSFADASGLSNYQISQDIPEAPISGSTASVLTRQKPQAQPTGARMASVDRRNFKTMFSPSNQFEQADRILWQARCLAEEWRGSFTAHLRFGCVATELKQVVDAEAANLLFLGCDSANHPIVKKLGTHLRCPVLGLPGSLDSEEKFNSYSEFRPF